MTTNQFPVVLSAAGTSAGNEEVVDANVAAVNAMYEALLGAQEIAPNALRSYFVDYYLTQVLDGGFAQYVAMSPDRDELDTYIREGFAGMGANKQLELFNRAVALFDSLSQEDARDYLSADLSEGEERTEGIKGMELLDGEFEDLLEVEDITGLSAAWLLKQEGLLVLDDDALAQHIAERVAKLPDLAERQAEADLENMPEFEAIIRELCAIAGHELEKITLGDPNFEHNGEKVLAWHFTTEKGAFLMIEEDEEAFMINPESKDVIAVLEFADEDEFTTA